MTSTDSVRTGAAELQNQVPNKQSTEDDGLSPTGSTQTAVIRPSRFWLLSFGVCLGLFLSIIDSSIIATSLYTIGVEFSAFKNANWVALAYTVAYLSCAVSFARVSDVIGRRAAFLAAYIIFFAFSIGCGFAQNLTQLVAFRAIQGVGGSGLYSLSMIILPEICPQHLRKYIGAMIGMVIAGSGVLGPILGGILTHLADWRWVFWINGPVGFVSMIVFFLTFPEGKKLPSVNRHSWKLFDFLGTILLIAAAFLTVFAFQNAGESSHNVWDRAIFVAPLVCGTAFWVALLVWEYLVEFRLKSGTIPAFPVSLFSNRTYASGAASTLFMGYPYLLIIFSFPTRAQIVSGKSSLVGGLMLLPMLGTTAVGTVIAGKMNSQKKVLSETLLVGACLMTLGCGLLTTVRASSDDGKAMGFLTFAGLGFGLSTAAATMLATTESPRQHHAAAQGILAQLRILGGSLGISASTVILRQEVTKQMAGVLTADERETLGGGLANLSKDRLSDVHTIYTNAFRVGMVSATIVSAVATLVAIGGFQQRRWLDEHRQQETVTGQITEEIGGRDEAKK